MFANHGRITMLGSARGSGVASPKIWGGAKFLGGKMFDFRRITLFSLAKPLSTHKMTIFSKKLGGHGPFRPPLVTPRAPRQEASLSPPCSKQVFQKQIYCIEESPCDIVGTFRRRPQSLDAS